MTTPNNDTWQAWVHVKWKPGTPENAWESWAKNNWVRGVWSTTGSWDAMVWVDAKSWDDLEKFVWKDVRTNQWVDRTETTWAKQWWAGEQKKVS